MNAGKQDSASLWGERPPPANGETDCLVVGPLVLWIRAVKNEIWLAHAYAKAGEPLPTEPIGAEGWSRWATKDAPHHLRIRPVFPDRPLVVKSEHPFTLLGKADARVYTRVPLWVRVDAIDDAGGGASRLTEVPTEVLSETWWGDFLDGELAYWVRTRALRQLHDELFEPHMVVCTLQLRNLSLDDLQVEKLVLRVEHLSIFERPGQLWAEEIRVDYHGEAEGSETHMDDHAPEEAGDATEISPARAQARSLRTRTFARLRALSGLGGS